MPYSVHTLSDAAADDADDDSDIVEAADVVERRRLQQLQAARATSVAPRSAIAAPRVVGIFFALNSANRLELKWNSYLFPFEQANIRLFVTIFTQMGSIHSIC